MFQVKGHFSLNTTIWFLGSAWEPNELQALPAELWFDRRLREAEPTAVNMFVCILTNENTGREGGRGFCRAFSRL